MKLLSRFLVLTTMVFLQFCGCEKPEPTPEPPTTVDAFEQNAKFQPSINLGNFLDAPSEGAWGLTLEADYFETIAEAGFSAVRLPVRWSAHTDTAAPYTIDPTFMARVNWAVDQALANDLAIMVNVHHYGEMNDDPQGQLPRLMSIWTQISQGLGNRPDDVVYELFNEPHDTFSADIWNATLPLLVDTLRALDPNRTLVVGCAEWGGLDGLRKLDIPDDDNMIVTVHYYNPFHFTHQGAEWSEGADAWLGTTWGSSEDVNQLRADFQEIDTWATAHNRPLNIGEFGAYYKADFASRLNWTQSIVQLCLQHGFSWSYWEYGAGFGAYDIESGEWNALKDVLVP